MKFKIEHCLKAQFVELVLHQCAFKVNEGKRCSLCYLPVQAIAVLVCIAPGTHKLSVNRWYGAGPFKGPGRLPLMTLSPVFTPATVIMYGCTIHSLFNVGLKCRHIWRNITCSSALLEIAY